MGENRSTRRATNEVVFRLVNEEIEALNIEVQGSTAAGSMDIVCECEDLACAERLDVTIDAYEDVRASPLLFFVTPGHERKDIERVVKTTESYYVVSKNPRSASGKAAVATDPRS